MSKGLTLFLLSLVQKLVEVGINALEGKDASPAKSVKDIWDRSHSQIEQLKADEAAKLKFGGE